MAICIGGNEKEQIEIILPDGRKVIVVILKQLRRSIANVQLSIIAPKDIKIERAPRRSKEENNSLN